MEEDYIQDYLNSIDIYLEPTKSEDGYVIDLLDSDEYGKIFSTLEKADDLELLDDNQVITDEGSSIMYQSNSEPYLISLLADWAENKYQLVINEIEEIEEE